MANHALEGTYNGFGKRLWALMFDLRNLTAEFETFLMIEKQPREIRGNRWYQTIQHIK
jgi:hypothetical protein